MRGLRQLDGRVYESRWGWLMPFGIFYKLGRGDAGRKERLAPYLLDPVGGWMYNAGRIRDRRQGRPTDPGNG